MHVWLVLGCFVCKHRPSDALLSKPGLRAVIRRIRTKHPYGVYIPTLHTKHPMVGDGWVAYCTYVPPPRHHAYHFYHLNKIISYPFVDSRTYRTLIATVTKVHKSRPQYAQYAPRNPACGVAGKRADGYERVLLRRVRRGLSRLGEGVAW